MFRDVQGLTSSAFTNLYPVTWVRGGHGLSVLCSTSGCRYAAILSLFCARHLSKWTSVVAVGWPGLNVRCISGVSSTAVTHTLNAHSPIHDAQYISILTAPLFYQIYWWWIFLSENIKQSGYCLLKHIVEERIRKD